MSSLPTFLKTWDLTKINTRVTPYVSLADMLGSLFYGIKNYMVATMGATVWGSCDGTTGDNTDRWASKANVATRGATTGNANSWIVIAWGTGQICFSYVGATDDVARISYSPSGSFVLAGTPTFTPTATDECIISAAVTIAGSGTSADRVYHAVASSDRSVLRVWIYRQGVIAIGFGFEKMAEAPGITVGTMYGWNSTAIGASGSSSGHHGGTVVGTTTGSNNSFIAYLGGAVRSVCGATVFNNGLVTNVGNATPAELNGGNAIWPLFVASVTAANTGWIGTRYDAFSAWQASPVLGGTFDDLTAGTRVIWIGTMLQPWSTTVGLVTS